jgi:hypothetical protein
MDPGNFADVPGKGVAYKAKRNGVEKFWEVTGWYAPPGDVFLSHDGKTLVRTAKIAPSQWYRIETDPEGAIGMVQHPDVFQLTTIEGAHFIFDLKNGNLLAKGILKEEESEKTKTDDVDPFADLESKTDKAEQPATAGESK